ncbi:MAG TPA: phosphotransferase [Methylomirabilota bacterium]|nr:phosphotransferase [Methylomirabilota bacterium]
MTKEITEATAAEILERHFKSRPKKIEQLHGGLSNFVYTGCVGGEEYIVRISHDPTRYQAFLKEQWSVTKVRELGVPTPDILEVANDGEGVPYMISHKVAGEPGQSAKDRIGVLKELGTYAARINSIETQSFGHIFDWSHNQLSRKQTWAEYVEVELHASERLEFFAKEKVLSNGALKRLRRGIAKLAKWDGRPSLTHGDLRLKNVVLDKEGKISAILDWETATSNFAAAWELSLALHDLSVDEKEAFLQGYGITPSDYLALSDSIKTLNVLNYFSSVTAALENASDPLALERLRMRLNGGLDLYSLGD